jgi:phospholipase D1/2
MMALRSSSKWSLGLQRKERSIQHCYIHSILLAKRFIYIENQFFISSTTKDAESNSVVRNRVVKALFCRIKKAVSARQKFKVVIFLPLLPAFQADLEKKQGKVMQVQLGLENITIRSLYAKIKTLTEYPEDYLMVCALRKFHEFKDPKKEPTTNLIYIHSKVEFADSS